MYCSTTQVNLEHYFLSDLSPRDKPWDVHKFEATLIQSIYKDSDFDRYAERMGECGGLLGFGLIPDPDTGEIEFKLKTASFCRVRLCPICQWRRSLMWIARFLGALPAISRDYPKARYLFLTLTVKNCEPNELRQTIKAMSSAWQKLTQRKAWPGLGFVRALEVTKGRDGSCHPHYHVLLMVRPSYFKTGYISQARWAELWQECLGVDYEPILDIRTVKPNRKRSEANLGGDQPDLDDLSQTNAAILETFKYSVKPGDAIGDLTDKDKEWFLTVTSQLHKTRGISLGGVFKRYLSDKEPENLITETDDSEDQETYRLHFGWREIFRRYVKIDL